MRSNRASAVLGQPVFIAQVVQEVLMQKLGVEVRRIHEPVGTVAEAQLVVEGAPDRDLHPFDGI